MVHELSVKYKLIIFIYYVFLYWYLNIYPFITWLFGPMLWNFFKYSHFILFYYILNEVWVFYIIFIYLFVISVLYKGAFIPLEHAHKFLSVLDGSCDLLIFIVWIYFAQTKLRLFYNCRCDNLSWVMWV